MITQEGDRLLVQGPVTIGTVSALLAEARALLVQGVAVLDFEAVTEVDSAAVALALECLDLAPASRDRFLPASDLIRLSTPPS